MSCLNYHLITGLGQIAGDDVPSWLLDYRFRLMFPQIKNPPETLWNQTAVCQYLLSQDSWVSKIAGRKNVNRAFDTFWFFKNEGSPGREQRLRVTVNFPPSEKYSYSRKKKLSHPLSVSLREPSILHKLWHQVTYNYGFETYVRDIKSLLMWAVCEYTTYVSLIDFFNFYFNVCNIPKLPFLCTIRQKNEVIVGFRFHF